MTRWSLLSEYFALILIVVIMLVFYDRRQVHSARRRLFWGCLRLSVASILLNIAFVHAIENNRPGFRIGECGAEQRLLPGQRADVHHH